jgi:hypothetical protein
MAGLTGGFTPPPAYQAAAAWPLFCRPVDLWACGRRRPGDSTLEQINSLLHKTGQIHFLVFRIAVAPKTTGPAGNGGDTRIALGQGRLRSVKPTLRLHDPPCRLAAAGHCVDSLRLLKAQFLVMARLCHL